MTETPVPVFRSLCPVLCFTALSLSVMSPLNAEHVIETPKELVVVCDVDVAVVGGSSGAVEAACEAARQGASVFLLAPEPYLGTDMCSALRLWLEEHEKPDSALALACFGADRVTTPATVKREMDRALLAAPVRYLTGCYVTDVLRDEDGQIAGVVIANRSGRQAVRAKVVVDATRQAAVARQAEVAFRPFIPGPQTFTRVVAGGEVRNGSNLSAATKSFTYDSVAKGKTVRLPVHEYTLRIPMETNTAASFLRAENEARDKTYQNGSELASEVLGYLPSDTMFGEGRLDVWPGAEKADFGPFRPRNTSCLYVLSAYADLSREAAERFLRPLELMEMGKRIGHAAAREGLARPRPGTAFLPETAVPGGIRADVLEELGGIRSSQFGSVRSGTRALPVLAKYDVVVVGGGTSGAPAGIGSARSGAKTLVIEYLHELGGVGTVGLIAKYWYGLRRGFTQYVDEQVNPGADRWDAVKKAEWLRRELRSSGAEVWFGSLGCGALVRDGQVCGVVVATPQGRGAVLATTVVDATGNADIAAWAGAETEYSISDTESLNVQIAGFPERPVGNSYVNTCYTMVDDTDVLDVSHLMAWKRTASENTNAFDMGQLIDSRERRRIVGDYALTVPDILSHRTFPDTISQHYSNFDAAAFPDSPILLISDAKGPCFRCDLPYRCLLPKDLDGILVLGLGASAERDSMTLIRMQADLQNQGYAAGMAAAEAARLGGHTRRIDLKALQARLVREGALDERVLRDIDSFPLDPKEIERAVKVFGSKNDSESLADLAVIVAHPKEATAWLIRRYEESPSGKEKLNYARILAILGDPTGVPALIAAVDANDGWDRGAALTSQRKTGNTFSDLDRLVIALGFSGSAKAVNSLLAKLGQLTPESPLSHYKAISLALWGHHTPAAAGILADLLDQVKFIGQDTTDPPRPLADRLVTVDPDEQANQTNLNRAFKELTVAALLYRCGDRAGKAEAVLNQYAENIHGHFASYARRVLNHRPAGTHGKE